MSAVERVGGPAKGSGHPSDCTCTRCAGFQAGHELSLRHGAYAVVALKPRAAEIATGLRGAMGERYEERWQPALEAVAIAGARLEAASGVLLTELDDADGTWLRLSQDARGWYRAYVGGLERLGLTPEHGTPGVNVQLTAVTVEHDAATQARLFEKLRQVGLVRADADVVEGEARELDVEGGVPESVGVPSSVRRSSGSPAPAETEPQP